MNIVQKQYNSISSYYEIFYSGIDKEEIYKTFIDVHKKYFNELKSDSIVSDCSCGNGLQAIAMKKKGINVIATDISEEMIYLTKENAKKEGLEFPILNISWQEMPKNYKNYFDLVFCWGNSISHSLSKEEMMINLKAIHTTMKNNSKLIIETRNWDKIIREKQRYYSYEEKIYNGKRVLPIYVMNVEGFDKESYLEMLFIEIDDDKKTKCNGFKLNFTPFSHEEFVKRLKESGFKVFEDSYDENNDFYSVVVEKLDIMYLTEDERGIYETEEKKRLDTLEEMRTAEEKGRKEGIKEGEKKKACEMALDMLKDGENIEKITRYTKLSKEEIEEISKGL